MADNSVLNAGSGGDTYRSDDRAGVKTAVVRLDVGSDATESIVDGTAAVPAALLPVGGKVVRIGVTPTISTTIYAAKDAVGGLLTFANAARASGGGIVLEAATIIDLDQEMAQLELVLFDQTFTASTDNAVFGPTDADLANVIGVIPFSVYNDFNNNSVAHRSALGLACKLAGTSLFGQLVVRSTPTYTATSDIVVVLHIRQF